MSNEIRNAISSQYIKGRGIEIGALHNPFPVPKNINLTYVDRMSEEELRKQYPELGGSSFPRAVIDNGETLEKFEDSSLDFIIASHFIEHTQDPIGTIKNFTRVLKLDGVILLVIPVRHATFDKDRPPTSWEHLYQDHINGPQISYEDHLKEWVTLVECRSDVDKRIEHLKNTEYSIHFHVWNHLEFIYFLNKIIELIPLQVLYFQSVGYEMYTVIQKKDFFESPFNEVIYLDKNPDVKNAVFSGQFSCGYEHWLKHGRYENRQ